MIQLRYPPLVLTDCCMRKSRQQSGRRIAFSWLAIGMVEVIILDKDNKKLTKLASLDIQKKRHCFINCNDASKYLKRLLLWGG